MNKLKRLQKKLGIEAAVVLAVLAGAGGIMMLSGGMAVSAVEKKTEADNALAQDNAQLASARSQLERSGEAEKRFVDIQLARGNPDFTSNIDALRSWMSDALARYRLPSNMKVTVPAGQPSDKPELSGLDYVINTYTGVTLEFEAISDLHVYSFLADMVSTAPGLVRITSLSLERKADMRPQDFPQMMGGMTPYFVTAKVTLDWIGINPKEESAKPADGAAPPPAPGAAPGMTP